MPKENQNQISTVLHLKLRDNTLAGTTIFELLITFPGTESLEWQRFAIADENLNIKIKSHNKKTPDPSNLLSGFSSQNCD